MATTGSDSAATEHTEELQLFEAGLSTDTVLLQSTRKNCKRLRQACPPMERVEGIALMTTWHMGGILAPDDDWKVTGKEWLGDLEKAKKGARMLCGIRTKGKGLEKCNMLGVAPIEPTGSHMWQLRHCSGGFDLLVRKADPCRKKRKACNRADRK